jgi:hypothetical protein
MKRSINSYKGKDEMLKIFAKKATVAPEILPFVGFRRGRGTAGFAFHIINGEMWTGLCGVDVIERKSEVTIDSIRAALPADHQGSYHCPDCVGVFLQ